MNNSNFRITLRPYSSAFAAFYKDASQRKRPPKFFGKSQAQAEEACENLII